MDWIYKNKPIEDISQFPKNSYGFVYLLTHKPTGKSYIGKKNLYFTRKVKLGKKELALLKEERKSKGLRGKTPSSKQVIKESDWKTYYGSHKDIKQLLKEGNPEDFERTILEISPNKKLLTYLEVKYQFLYQVLEHPDKWFNDNILGKFYTQDLDLKDSLEDVK